MCGGEHMSVNPSEIEGEILCVFFSFWAEVLTKAVDFKCEQVFKPLFLGVAKCAVVRMCFPTRLTP